MGEVDQTLIALFLGEAFFRGRLGASFDGCPELLRDSEVVVGGHGVARVGGGGGDVTDRASRLGFGGLNLV
jgi:hypothetical protein